jgi:zinc D-Ala-D-Ala carboxypeptidase
MSSSAHFSAAELTCKCGCKGNKMQAEFLERLELLRKRYGKPMVLTSAYRCPSYNVVVSSSGPKGPHTTGRAIDVRVRGAEAYVLLVLALECGFTGIGVAQKGASRFLHLDDLPPAVGRPRPRVWSY